MQIVKFSVPVCCTILIPVKLGCSTKQAQREDHDSHVKTQNLYCKALKPAKFEWNMAFMKPRWKCFKSVMIYVYETIIAAFQRTLTDGWIVKDPKRDIVVGEKNWCIAS